MLLHSYLFKDFAQRGRKFGLVDAFFGVKAPYMSQRLFQLASRIHYHYHRRRRLHHHLMAEDFANGAFATTAIVILEDVTHFTTAPYQDSVRIY